MNLKNLFITDTAEFEARRLGVEKVFHCNATLPDQVFREEFKFFGFESFDLAMADDFSPVIQELAETSGDDSVLMAVLDPDPSSYYKKEFGYYNWAEVPVSISGDAYLDLLNEHPEGSPADSLHVNSYTVIGVPKSAKWAVWGNRSYETCVVGFRDDIPMGSLHGIRWALDIYLTYAFKYDLEGFHRSLLNRSVPHQPRRHPFGYDTISAQINHAQRRPRHQPRRHLSTRWCFFGMFPFAQRRPRHQPRRHDAESDGPGVGSECAQRRPRHQPRRHLRYLVQLFSQRQRSTKAEASAPATLSASSSEHRMKNSAQRRPGHQPRRHGARCSPLRHRSPPLNEGRGISPGDTRS